MIVKIPVSKAPSTKRGRGERAGLTREIILKRALHLVEADGLDGFSIRKLATKLGVNPRAVHAHLEGGMDELLTALVQATLWEVPRPFRPRETPAEYLCDLFRAVLAAVHAHPDLARIVASKLSQNYLLNPHLPECVLVALSEAGVADEDLVPALDLVMGALVGLLWTEAVKLQRGPHAARKIMETIAALPQRQFGMLHKHSETLAQSKSASDSAEPNWRAAHRFAALLISGLPLVFGSKDDSRKEMNDELGIR